MKEGVINMENLDRLCAKYGFEFTQEVNKSFKDASKTENLLTKSLGVLQEQGLYAFILFCESRGDREQKGAVEIKKITRKILKDELKLIESNDLLEEIRKENGLASNLEGLTLSIQVLEKALIYARYHAKALKRSTENTIIGEKAA